MSRLHCIGVPQKEAILLDPSRQCLDVNRHAAHLARLDDELPADSPRATLTHSFGKVPSSGVKRCCTKSRSGGALEQPHVTRLFEQSPAEMPFPGRRRIHSRHRPRKPRYRRSHGYRPVFVLCNLSLRCLAARPLANRTIPQSVSVDKVSRHSMPSLVGVGKFTATTSCGNCTRS
jgi:hypothetical protein